MSFTPIESPVPGFYISSLSDRFYAAADGNLWDSFKNKLRIGHNRTCSYVRVMNGKRRYIVAHRITCAAFYGPPKDDRPFVNHKDGIKNNNHKDNLEWCNDLENVRHAFATGLHYLRKIEVLDILENKVNTYSSKSVFTKTTKIYPRISKDWSNLECLIHSRYLIKYQEDTRPWPSLNFLRSNFILVRHLHTGKETMCLNGAEVSRLINASEEIASKYLKRNLQYLKGYLFKKINDPAPWFTGERLKKAIDKSGIAVIIRDCINNVEKEFDSVYQAHNFCNIGYFNYARALRHGRQYVTKGILIKKVDCVIPWMSDEELDTRLEIDCRGIRIVHPDNNVTLVSTLNEAIEITKIPSTTMRHYLTEKANQKVKGWSFSYIGLGPLKRWNDKNYDERMQNNYNSIRS